MLVWQAAIAHRIWYQAEFALAAIARADRGGAEGNGPPLRLTRLRRRIHGKERTYVGFYI